MKIVGIDPGSHRTGYGVVVSGGSAMRALCYGVIQAPANAPLGERLNHIYRELCGVIAHYKPDAAAIEDVFHAKNARSALKLGQARGAAVLAVSQAGLKVFEYPPATVKCSVAASGRAGKEQVKRMVMMMLGLDDEKIPEDASDALSVAICHCNRISFSGR